MQDAADATPSGMVSILGLERPQVEELCASRPAAARRCKSPICSAPAISSISGTNAACERAAELAPAAGAMKAVPLAVAGAFHTPIMDPAVERLADGAGRRADARARRFR